MVVYGDRTRERARSLIVLVLLISFTAARSQQVDWSTALGGRNSLDAYTAVKLAESHRPLVTAAEMRLKAAMRLRYANSAYYPLRLETGDGTMPSFDAGEDFLLAQPIDLFGTLNVQRSVGDAQVQSAKAELKQAKLDVQTEALDSLADAASADLLYNSAVELQSIAQKLSDATKKRVDEGDLPKENELRADLELQSAMAVTESRRRARIGARARLAAALGLSTPPKSIILDLAPIRAAGGGVNDRPDVQLAVSAVAAADADKRLQRLSSSPSFELQFRRNYWELPEKYNFRVQMTWSLWDHGAARAKVSAATELQGSAKQTLADTTARAVASIIAAQADYAASLDSVTRLAKLQTDAQSLLEKMQKGFQLGGATLLDVFDSERTLRTIEENLYGAQVQLAKSAAALAAEKGALLN